jgi:hypothetical protein
VPRAEPAQSATPGRRQTEPDDALVVAVGAAPDQSQRFCPIDQTDRAVVPDQEHLGHLADGRSPRIAVPADREEQLMLHRGQPRCGCLFLAPMEEPTEADPELEQPFVVSVGNLWGHKYIVSR